MREQEVSSLSDFEIWKSVVMKFVLLELPLQQRIDMIMQAVGGNIDLIIAVLSASMENDALKKSEVKQVLDTIKNYR